MLCCLKTGVKITRCESVTTNNQTSPQSLGYSNHPIIWQGLLALVSYNSSHQDNFDEAGLLRYRTYIAMLPASVYLANPIKIADYLSYNFGYLGDQKIFDQQKQAKEGFIYSVRELLPSRVQGKFYELKIRFDLI